MNVRRVAAPAPGVGVRGEGRGGDTLLLLADVLDQVDDAVAVAELVIVPVGTTGNRTHTPISRFLHTVIQHGAAITQTETSHFFTTISTGYSKK